jgi:hypothetical protein
MAPRGLADFAEAVTREIQLMLIGERTREGGIAIRRTANAYSRNFAPQMIRHETIEQQGQWLCKENGGFGHRSPSPS